MPQWSITQDVAWDHIRLNHDLSDMVSSADAVCFGTLALRNPESRETILSLLHDCKPSAIRYFDINIREQYYSKELIQELLELSSVFKINDDELEILRPMFNLPEGDEEACKWFINTYSLDYVILTAGAKYSIVASKTELSKFYTPKVPVVDTVGAGDAFSGVFTMGILEGRSLREAHRAAVNTAAYVCTQNGAWPDYPEEIPDYAASVPENELPQE